MRLVSLRPFDATRALQAAAVLFRRQRTRQLSSSRLLALFYFADRESIAETGRPIVGGQLHSTDRGPLLETVLRLIRGEHSDSPHFARFVARNHYLLELIDDPGNGSLSRYEIAKLHLVAERFDGSDDWEVVEAAIALPESQRGIAENLSEIPLEFIVEAVGRGADLAAIFEDSVADAKAAAFFAPPVVPQPSDDLLAR